MNDPRWPIYLKKRDQDPYIDWRTPISFYGKVVDDSGAPVSGAAANLVWNDLSPRGTSRAQLISDAGGKFSIAGIHGKGMTVEVSKPGYENRVAKNRSDFEYAGFWEPTYHEPDPVNPVVFHLRKKAEAEPMVHYGPTLFSLPSNGAPAYFDLAVNRKTTEGAGNLAVRVSKGAKVNKRFDWQLTIEAVNGAGLIDSGEEFLMRAPAEGYETQWTFAQQANDPQFKSETQARFCVRTREGKFARILVRVFADYNEAPALDLEVFLNPSGSPNLEFDARKAVALGSR
jgi:hypothetical protein